MNDDNYLKDIISTSKTIAVKTYYFLEDILVFKEYEIDENTDLITQTKQFILRYRRIIGLILLAILLYIWFYCDININKSKLENNKYNSGIRERVQKGGLPKVPSSFTAKIKQGAGKLGGVFHSKAGTELQREKLKDSYKDSAMGKKVEEMKSMRSAGFSTTKVIGKNVYQAGAYAGEKFKEFAGWLYEILFAIAISIAICMVVLPSISFFILALICFFLLKKKVAAIKGL